MTSKDDRAWLLANFSEGVKFDEPMRYHTSFRVGGAADIFVSPKDLNELRLLLQWVKEKNISFLVIGGGTNLLVKDSGIRGIVISLAKNFKKIQCSWDKNFALLRVQSGALTPSLCNFAINHALAGMNFALGIPGTVGGAIQMNAGTAMGCMADVLQSIDVMLPSGEIKTVPQNSLKPSYRQLKWSEDENAIILEASFSLEIGKADAIKREAQKLLKMRKKRQPTNLPSAGCFFKNPENNEPAGKLIEMAGLKGTFIGGAEISVKHANFIINKANASTQNILDLMEFTQESVMRLFNVKLKPEVRIVGI